MIIFREVNLLTYEEIQQLTDKVYSKIKNVPGVDKDFVGKCLQGINALEDLEVEQKIKLLAKFL
jgi:hypothetical protein